MNAAYFRECDLVGDRACSVKKVHHMYISPYLKFQAILEFVSHQLVESSHGLFNAIPTERKTACLFTCYCMLGWCSNITKSRWEVVHAFISYDFQDIVCQILSTSVQAALSYRRKHRRQFFETRVRSSAPNFKLCK